MKTYSGTALQIGDNTVATTVGGTLGVTGTLTSSTINNTTLNTTTVNAGVSRASSQVETNYLKTYSGTALQIGDNTVATTVGGTLGINSLTASYAVTTDGSKKLVSYPYTSTNTSSALVSRDSIGFIFASGFNKSNTAINSVSNGGTITDAYFKSGIVSFNTGTTITVTTDTAVNLITTLGLNAVNDSYVCYFYNSGTFSATINGGTGVTVNSVNGFGSLPGNTFRPCVVQRSNSLAVTLFF